MQKSLRRRTIPSHNQPCLTRHIWSILTAILLCVLMIVFIWIGRQFLNDINKNTNLINASKQELSTNNNNKIEYNMQTMNDIKLNENPLRMTLSFALNVDPQRIYLFLSSYRRYHPSFSEETNKKYKLFLFCKFSEEKYLKEYKRFANYFDIELVDIGPIESKLDQLYYSSFNRKMKYIRVNKRRFFILFDWLKSYKQSSEIDSIFLSDCNDVIFQGNIFSLEDETLRLNAQTLAASDELFWFFMENEDVVMDGEKWNIRYIRYCFGNESIPLYHDLHVSCSGTSLGTYYAMYNYLEIMNSILVTQGPLFEDCLAKAGDQALHNHILHRELLDEKGIKVIRVPNDSGWVLQITTMINHPILSKEVPKMAHESMVVHQWKWAQTLVNEFEKKYNYPNFCTQQGWDDCTIRNN